jgi:hypothetical protein
MTATGANSLDDTQMSVDLTKRVRKQRHVSAVLPTPQTLPEGTATLQTEDQMGLNPCLQSMAKVSSTVCGLARSAPGVHRVKQRPGGLVSVVGCQRGHATHLTPVPRGPLPGEGQERPASADEAVRSQPPFTQFC